MERSRSLRNGTEAWEIFSEGKVLHVRIAAPVADWSAIFDSVSEHLRPRPDAVALPAELPGGTASDTEMLRTLWGSLMDLGLTVYREAAAPRSGPAPGSAPPRVRSAHPAQRSLIPGI